jgi:hypothetical protein
LQDKVNQIEQEHHSLMQEMPFTNNIDETLFAIVNKHLEPDGIGFFVRFRGMSVAAVTPFHACSHSVSCLQSLRFMLAVTPFHA